MRTRLRSKVTLLFMSLGMLLAVPAVAIAADLNTDVNANLSSDVNTPTVVDPNDSKTFNIKVWATGNISSNSGSATGLADVANSYTMASNGVITPDSGSTTTLKFNVGHNYSSGCPTNVQPQAAGVTGCGSSDTPFVVPATLNVGNAANGTDGTLTVSMTGSPNLNLRPATTPGGTSESLDSGYVEVSAPTTPTNSDPVVASDNASRTVNESQTATNTGTWSDANTGDTVDLTASVGDVEINADGTWRWSYATTDGPEDSQTVTITATDNHGASNSTTFALTVANVAPTVAFTAGPTSVNEGSTEHTYSYSITDPGTDTVQSVTTSCGANGVKVTNSDTNTNTGGSFKCTFADGPKQSTVSAQATDSDGAAGNTASQTVNIANVAPSVNIDAITKPDGTALGSVACLAGNSISLDFSFTDPGTNDTHSASIDWDDPNDSTDTVISSADPSPVLNQEHTYSGPGSHTIKVTVTDNDHSATGNGLGTATSNANQVSFLYNLSAIQPPFNPDGSSTWKYGSTIPVKVKITDCNNQPVSGLSPKLGIILANSATPGAPINESDIASTSGADNPNAPVLRYDATAGQYIYNLSTKYTEAFTDQNATYWAVVRGLSQDGTTVVTNAAQVSQKFGLKSK